MNVQKQVKKYITSQPESKRSEMQALHRAILQVMPACKLSCKVFSPEIIGTFGVIRRKRQ
ncbi:MAG TPA: hypothetical protein PKO16_07210 [Bacteroidia bacterium]|nr:hypothetical protein [Bacteroidia bacterium]